VQHDNRAKRGGWIIGQSMAMELDAVFWTIRESATQPPAHIPEHIHDLLKRIPEEWMASVARLLPDMAGPAGILEYLALPAGVVAEADYSVATLAMREMTVAAATGRLREEVVAAGLSPEAEGEPVAQLATLLARLTHHLYDDLGLSITPAGSLKRRMRSEIAHVSRLLQGGDLHTRFWHWLDRLYYESYRPWRETQADTLAMLEEEALLALGARSGDEPPNLEWLPPQNPLRYRQEVRQAVEGARLQAFFWVEPFGLPDFWTLFPGRVLVSFARPGEIYANFREFADDVAGRVKALSDPTRLLILRMIRNMSMDNTAMADFLELSRPTVSVHAKQLREAGLIRTRRHGRQAQHEIVPEELHRLFLDLQRFLDLPPEDDR